MRLTIRPLPLFAATTLLFAQNTSGIDPRPNPAAYPAHANNEAVSLGAALLRPSDQKKLLEKDWSGSYIIVEVGVYPEPGKQISVAPKDFMLRAGGNSAAPVDATVVMPTKNNKPLSGGPAGRPESPVHVTTVEGVGVATGPNGRKQVYTDSAVYVGVGNTPYPGSTPPPPGDPNFDARHALEDKELPDAKTHKPIAGYLYFPKFKSPKDEPYELTYYGADGELKLTLVKK
jgi:hypothetical protein